MKLGIAYNIFDGEEMLPYTLKNHHPFAYYKVIIYQEVSNFGNKNENLKKELLKLKEEGLVDELVCYTPHLIKNEDKSVNWKSGTINEQKKRQLGLDYCRKNGCDTFMTLDCDELYDHEQFKWAMEDFERGGYDTSFTKLLTYYKKPTLQLTPPEEWYQPLFYKIKKKTKFEFFDTDNYPVFTDRTKMVKAGYCRVYTREEIEQHHFAYIRHNLISKTTNSSAQTDEKSKLMVNYQFDNWKKGDGALLIGLQKFGLKEVDNKFNIKL